LLGVVLVAGVSWWLAGLALRPLRALRDSAGRVTTTRDLSTRLPADGAPEEVSELSTSINSMLARLETSAGETDAALDATRRFAGDAGHELRTPMTALRANLGALRRNPDLTPAQGRAAIEDADRDAGRAARLLDVLQTLARGDAWAALPRESVDLSALTEAALDGARSRHPEVSWQFEAPEQELRLSGWPDGLRALIDNVLENAARHGRPAGEVRAKLERDANAVVLTVDDDGPGVAEADRERIFERFTRAGDARTDGSGLGLALVRQQAELHGGDVSVTDSPLGGARFRVRLAAAPAG
jgi:two-component system sensor histidine kinase PrrB